MTVFAAYARAARYFREDGVRIVFSTLLIGLTTLTSLAQPFPLAILIDAVLMHKPNLPRVHRVFLHVAPSGTVGQIVLLAFITLVCGVSQELVGIWQGYYKITIGYNGLLRVRCDLYRKFQDLSLAYHRARPQGDAIYRINYDSLSILNAFNVMQTTFVNIIILVCMSAIMLDDELETGADCDVGDAGLFGTIKYYGKILTTSARRAAEVDSQLTAIVQRSVTAITLVQSFGREEHEYGRFHDRSVNPLGPPIRMHMHSMLYWLAIGTAFGIGLGLIFGFGGYFAYKDPLKLHHRRIVDFPPVHARQPVRPAL